MATCLPAGRLDKLLLQHQILRNKKTPSAGVVVSFWPKTQRLTRFSS